jgi:hypothetical protein
MTSRAKRRNDLLKVIGAVAVLGFSPDLAQAQWGWGWGWGGFSQVPKPESFLNSKALISAANPPAIPSRNVYANNPNSYINHIRDNGFVDRYSVARREPSAYRYAPRTTPPATPVAQQTPTMPLASFYNAQNQFVWPADAPTAGDLQEKRHTFDQASQAVLLETKQNGVASIAAVTDARQKLVDYGQPALQFVRSHETPRIADLFHVFLLSVYESLAQAVNPPGSATATATPGGST